MYSQWALISRISRSSLLLMPHNVSEGHGVGVGVAAGALPLLLRGRTRTATRTLDTAPTRTRGSCDGRLGSREEQLSGVEGREAAIIMPVAGGEQVRDVLFTLFQTRLIEAQRSRVWSMN
jgi:hypothetical protein